MLCQIDDYHYLFKNYCMFRSVGEFFVILTVVLLLLLIIIANGISGPANLWALVMIFALAMIAMFLCRYDVFDVCDT